MFRKRGLSITLNRLHLCIACLFVLTTALGVVHSNQMDPHVFPDKGCFFEGWYMRVLDVNQQTSLGWIFSRVQPEEERLLSHNPTSHPHCHHNQTSFTVCSSTSGSKTCSCPVKVTLLVSSGPTSKLVEEHAMMPENHYTLTKNGHPIKSNPDKQSPAEFEAKLGDVINFVVRPHGTKFSISVGESTLKGETASPIPWGPHGEGPESWLDNLHLPVQWFVYSLGSEVKYYEYINHKTGQNIKGTSEPGKPIVAHMEKNWGCAFPKAWVWAQGVNPINNVSFACSSGTLHKSKLDIKAELSGYRNPSKNIECNFHPLNSVHVLEQDGCKGFVRLKAIGRRCVVTFDISVDPSLLSSCLTTPQVHGYGLGCVESYNAVANITVLQRHGLRMEQTDSQIIEMTALEFGGSFMCHDQCN